jgi:hypothetical protein
MRNVSIMTVGSWLPGSFVMRASAVALIRIAGESRGGLRAVGAFGGQT